MPTKPLKPCAMPGCPNRAEPGRPCCKLHSGQQLGFSRESSTQRGYSYKWRQASKAYLRSHPMCALCLRKNPPQYIPATVVDHIIPHRGDKTLFWDRNNWQPLCKPCHDLKTWREDSNPEYSYIPQPAAKKQAQDERRASREGFGW